MIDHTSIAVRNLDISAAFYDDSLTIIGYSRLYTLEEQKVIGYGKGAKPSFWISTQGKDTESIGSAKGVHIAFVAPSKESVDEWHAVCRALGGKDNGKPGPRPEYHPGYYGAFIIDPDGWRIEACFHEHKGE